MRCIIVYQPNQFDIKNKLEKALLRCEYQIKALAYNEEITGVQLYQRILAADPDLVFTIDLTGFNIKTDTDDIAYINLSCPNIHFICGSLEPERFACLAGKLSIAMFFYCLNQEICSDLLGKYPEIPYLKFVADLETGVGDVVEEIYG